MRDCLGDLGLRQAIVPPDRDMAGQLRDLTIGNQGADRDQAAVERFIRERARAVKGAAA